MYASKTPDALSWWQAHLLASLDCVQAAAFGAGGSVIDIGGGQSTLADDVLARGVRGVSAFDNVENARVVSRQRLGKAAAQSARLNALNTQESLRNALARIPSANTSDRDGPLPNR